MSVSEDAAYYVGVDWAAETHAVCVLDHRGKVVTHFPVPHTADGIASLIRRLARLGEAAEIPVGIERPNGRLVDLLLEAGHPVVPVSPNAIKTWRDGEVLSGAKSDAGGRRDRGVPAAPRAPAPGRARLLRRDQGGAAHGGPDPRRPGRHAGCGHQSAGGAVGRALARRQGHLRRHRVPDRAGVPDPLPDLVRRMMPTGSSTKFSGRIAGRAPSVNTSRPKGAMGSKARHSTRDSCRAPYSVCVMPLIVGAAATGR